MFEMQPPEARALSAHSPRLARPTRRSFAARLVAALLALACAALATPDMAAARTALARAAAAQDPDPVARWRTGEAAPLRVALRAPVPSARPRKGGSVSVEIAPAQDAVLAPVPEPRPRKGARTAARTDEPRARARPAPADDDAGAAGSTTVRDAGAARPAQTAGASAARAATIRGAAPPRQTSLLGIIAGPNGRVALLRSSTGEVRRMKVGDRIEGMTVAAVGDNSVQLQGGDGRRVLTVPSR
jgi:hypothetical protein